MLQPLSFEITQEIIQACFGQANVVPSSVSDIFGQEWAAWSAFMGCLGICCNEAMAKNNENIKDLLEDIRSFFIDEQGQIKPNRVMSLSLLPSNLQEESLSKDSTPRWERAQDVHVSTWKKAPRPF